MIDDAVADIDRICRWFAPGTIVRRDGGQVFGMPRRAA